MGIKSITPPFQFHERLAIFCQPIRFSNIDIETSVNQNLGWMWIWWTCKTFVDLHSWSMCWSASCRALLSDMQKFYCQI